MHVFSRVEISSAILTVAAVDIVGGAPSLVAADHTADLQPVMVTA